MVFCSYLKAWGSPYNLKVKFLNTAQELNLHESKVPSLLEDAIWKWHSASKRKEASRLSVRG